VSLLILQIVSAGGKNLNYEGQGRPILGLLKTAQEHVPDGTEMGIFG
jgi:hypothetical protein